MGNLRSKYTNEEWEALEEESKKMPNTSILSLGISNKTLEDLLKIKKALEPFYTKNELKILKEWINQKT